MAWRKSNEIYNHDQHSGPTVIFSGTGSGQAGLPPRAWHTIDLKPLGVSADATFAELNGFLVITHGSVSGTADLTVTVRPVGSTLHEGNYQLQTIEPWVGGGARQVQGTIVALNDGKLQLYWKNNFSGSPDNGESGSVYLINLWLEKWGRNNASLP